MNSSLIDNNQNQNQNQSQNLYQTVKIFIPSNKNIEIHYLDNVDNNNTLFFSTSTKNSTDNHNPRKYLSGDYYKMVEENCRRSGGNLI